MLAAAQDCRGARGGAHCPRRPERAGALTELIGSARDAPPEAQREAGAAANRVKQALELEALASPSATRRSQRAAPAGPALDLTMPRAARVARRQASGHARASRRSRSIFREIGFTIAPGPEAETEWYNFGALNFPADHPAMDMHDTLYLEGGALLRTHTSPVQVRTLQGYAPPIRILVPGNVYRRDFFDASHAPMFAQIEGLAVDEGISFVDLKATLTHFAAALLRRDASTRFRPSYFPFTEPSAEMDVTVRRLPRQRLRGVQGHGLDRDPRLRAWCIPPCSRAPASTASATPAGPSAWVRRASRSARYGIPDIRLLYDSDVAVLEQFAS